MKFIPMLLAAVVLAGVSGCGDGSRTTVIERKVDRDDNKTTIKTKTETRHDDGTIETRKTKTEREVDVNYDRDDDNLIKIGPLEIKEP